MFFEAGRAAGESARGALPWDPCKAIVAPRPIARMGHDEHAVVERAVRMTRPG